MNDQEEVEQTPAEAEAAEAKVETALATVDKSKQAIKVGEKGIAFETAAELYRMAQAFVQGNVAPKGSNPGGVMAAILKGRALGLDEITSVTQIMMISGRTMMAGALILGLLKRAGICYRFHWDGEGNTRAAHIVAWDPSRGEKRGDWPEHVFSMGDAVRAGLTSKKGDSYRAWPDEMLLWRAVSKMGRQQFPEVCAGIYVPGEIPGDPQVTPDPEPPEQPALPPPTKDPLFEEPLEAQVVEPAGIKTVEPGAKPAPAQDILAGKKVEPGPQPPTKEEIRQELKALVDATRGAPKAKTRRGALKKAIEPASGAPPCSKCGGPLGEKVYDTDTGVVCEDCKP